MGAARDLQDIESILKSTELQHKTTSMTANNDIQLHFSPSGLHTLGVSGRQESELWNCS